MLQVDRSDTIRYARPMGIIKSSHEDAVLCDTSQPASALLPVVIAAITVFGLSALSLGPRV